MALSRAEGWPHRVEDWALVVDRSQGVVALEGTRVVAAAVATPFGPVATANMILVDQDLRGRGIGRRIMESAMARLAPAEWRLVATQAGLPLYRRIGFAPCGDVVQHQGVAQAAPGALPACWAEPADVPRLVELDQAATGMERGWLMEALVRDGRVLVHREGASIGAFAGLRRFGLGEAAGPVVARSEADAHALLATLLTATAGRFLRVDLLGGTRLAGIVDAHGLPQVGRGVLMRLGAGPVPSHGHRCFALASQALC